MADDEERDADTALHEREIGMDRPAPEEMRERLRRLAQDLGLDPDVVIRS